MTLTGRVVLITGTAGGMGAAAASLFAGAGATVVGCDIRPVDGSEPVDLTDEDAVRRWADAAVVGRHVYYDNTRFDGSGGTDVRDDDAIAPEKRALLPGETATLASTVDTVWSPGPDTAQAVHWER